MSKRRFIETYHYEDYVFTIEYSSSLNLYFAKSQFGETYDTDLFGLKQKIRIVVYQHTEFRL